MPSFFGSESEWEGIWADLTIEQTMMKNAKSRGCLVGGLMRSSSSIIMWFFTLHHLSTINGIV